MPEEIKDQAIRIPQNEQGRSFHLRLIEWVGQKLNWLFPVRPNETIIKRGLKTLKEAGETPDVILVCQPDFLAPSVSIPQWVVARTYPVSFRGYFGQLFQSSSSKWLHRLLSLWFWYRMDRKGYRLAHGVLAMSNALFDQLQKMKINACLVYPGVWNINPPGNFKVNEKLYLVTSALHLESKRKNVDWMIQALSFDQFHRQNVNLTLIGKYSVAFEKDIRSRLHFDIEFTGFLCRNQAMGKFLEADIFVFTSLQENWGYVLIEAMAHGCAVFAPDQYPFTEIVGRTDYLFSAGNMNDFSKKLNQILADKGRLTEDKQWFFNRYVQLFSGAAFGRSLMNAIITKTTF